MSLLALPKPELSDPNAVRKAGLAADIVVDVKLP